MQGGDYWRGEIDWATAKVVNRKQLTQLGVISAGTSPFSDSWFKQHAPYTWDLFPQGTRQAEMLGDYYCKKMWGQNASRAGDPTMQIKKRKLGIITTEDAPNLEVAQQFKKIVTGGGCGSDADGTTIYTQSSDATTAENQYPTLVTRMKISPTDGSPAEMDATEAICSLVSTSRARLDSASATAATAASMPRLSAIGLAPAATLRRPSRTSA